MAVSTSTSRARTILTGTAALGAILASLVGVPLLLLTVGGNPLPAGLPAPAEMLAALTRPDDGSLFLGGLRVVGWLAWAGWALSLLSCLPGQFTGRRAPRVPGLGGAQLRAGALTGAVTAMIAVLVTSTAASTPAAAAPAPTSRAPVAPVATAPAHPTPSLGPAHQVIVVKGDTLWGIANQHLGAGARYPELYAASQGTVQPDGRQLSNPNRIHPGWTITVPAKPANPAPNPPTSAPPPGPATSSGVDQATPGAPSATGDPGQPASAPVNQAPASTPATNPPAGADPRTAAPATTAATSDQDERRTLGVGALAAAGLLGLLALARARQSRRRAPGRRIALPTGRPAALEADLRGAADPLAVDDLNRALRTLAGRAHTLGTPMPALRAARITVEALEFYLVHAADRLPAPFSCVDEGTWALHRANLSALLTTDEAADIPAPYPTLVTIGHDEHQALLLLNLEELGALSLTGDPRLCREVLSAITAELIASSWADDIRVTLVHLMPELVDALACDRASHTDTLEDTLTGLEYTARVHRHALQAAAQPGATQARVARVVEESWTPHLLAINGEVTPAQRDRLAHLVTTHPRVALAVLTANTTPVGEWTLHVTSAPNEDGNAAATLNPAAVVLTPQRLPNERYQDLVALYQSTKDPDRDGPDWASDLDDAPVNLTSLPPATARTADLDPNTAGGDRGTPRAGTERPDQRHTETNALADHPTSPADERPAAPKAQQGLAAERAEDTRILNGSTPARTNTGESAEPPPTLHAQHGAVVTSAEDDTDALILAHPATQPLVRLLGPVPTLTGQRGKRPGSPKRCLEILTYLALHPGQPYQRFDEAIFPGERVTAGKRNQYLSNTRQWVGCADDGHPHVALVEEAGYRLAADTAVDWWLLQRWVTPSVTTASTDKLRAALALVDGQPLSGVDADRYQWAMSDRAEILASVADVAHELARRAITSGDARTATWAAAKGLEAEPVSETLWRDAITAGHLSGDQERVREVIARCRAVLEPLGPDLEDETQQLINQSLRMAAHA